MNPTQFNILALDGGGLKGVYSAAILAAIEEDFDVRIVDHVDLIGGTSTGGIIALALASGVSPADLVEMYCRQADAIFPRRPVRLGVARRRYSTDGLRTVLTSVLGDRRFGDSTHRLVIPSYNIDAGDVYVFRTPHTERLRRDWRESAVDVALATSAAPMYFGVHRLRDVRLVDGGVWANNPSMVALAEAINSCDQQLDDIHMLSLGTTIELRRASKRLSSGGVLQWGRPLVPTMLAGQARAAENHCFLLLGDQRFHRINPVVPPGLARLDRVTPEELISRARSDSRHASPRITAFLAHRATPYQPLYPSTERHDDV